MKRKKASHKAPLFARLLAVLVLAVGGAVAVAPAASAVTCYGDYCSGQDPEATGCSADAYTSSYHNTSYFSVQLRYSPTCKTNWTRVVMYAPGWSCSHSGWMSAVQDTGYTQSAYFSSVCNTSVATTRWTPMIYSPVRLVQGRFTDQNGVTYSTSWA